MLSPSYNFYYIFIPFNSFYNGPKMMFPKLWSFHHRPYSQLLALILITVPVNLLFLLEKGL